MKEEIFEKTKIVFRKVFQKADLEIKLSDAAHNIPGWDSLAHMTLIHELEVFFRINFTFDEVTDFKNIEDIVNLVTKKLST